MASAHVAPPSTTGAASVRAGARSCGTDPRREPVAIGEPGDVTASASNRAPTMTPTNSHTTPLPDGPQAGKRHPEQVGRRGASVPPSTGTESGRAPALPESSGGRLCAPWQVSAPGPEDRVLRSPSRFAMIDLAAKGSGERMVLRLTEIVLD